MSTTTDSAVTAPADLLAQILEDASAPTRTSVVTGQVLQVAEVGPWEPTVPEGLGGHDRAVGNAHRAPGHAAVAKAIAYDVPTTDLVATAQQRVAATNEAATAAGFEARADLPSHVSGSAGTYHAEIGPRRASKHQREFMELPEVAAACAAVVAAVKAEDRKDVDAPLHSLAMDSDNHVMRCSGDGAPLVLAEEPLAQGPLFSRIAQFAGVKSPGGLMGYDSRTLKLARAGLFNGLVSAGMENHEAAKEAARVKHANLCAELAGRRDAGEADVPADPALKLPEAPTLLLRTRVNPSAPGHRTIAAVVSDSYSAVDADALAQACADASANRGGLRGEARYRRDRMSVSIDMLAHTDVRPDGMAAGDAMQCGARLTSRDDGGGGIKTYAILYRHGCGNMMIVSLEVQRVASVRHVGKSEDLLERVVAAIDAALAKVDHWLAAWGHGCQTKVVAPAMLRPGRKDKHSRETLSSLLEAHERDQQAAGLVDEILAGAYRGLLAEIGLDVPRTEREAVVAGLVAAHGDERNVSMALDGGPSLASLANGLSLWAHDGNDDPDRREAAELAAGRVLGWTGELPWEATAPVAAPAPKVTRTRVRGMA